MINLTKTNESMKAYEVMYITLPNETADTTALELVKGIINAYGSVEKVDAWGKKRLAYRIEDNEEGIYTLVTFNSSHKGIVELDRKLRNSEEVMRHMIISKA